MGKAIFARRIPGFPFLFALALFGCDTANFDGPFTLYTSIAAADLNGDGKTDIAMTDSYISGSPPHPGHAAVLLQDPVLAGEFSPARRYDTGNDPQCILVGDINGDGRPDLVVANQVVSANRVGTNSVSILLQDPGNPGGFLPSSDIPVGQSPTAGLGDVDGDGKPDLLVGTTSDPVGISLLRQSSSNPGKFEPPVLIAPIPGVSAIIVKDLDGDELQDIAVAANTGIFVLIQNPSAPGTFFPAAGYAAGSQPVAIAAADLNGDDRPDLAVANYGSPDGSIPASVSVLIQDPAMPGKFLPAIGYVTGIRSVSVAIGDLNGDGKADLAVANPVTSGSTGNVSILFQSPGNPGSFLPAVYYPGISQPLSVAIGDMNGDGNADIVVADSGAVIYFQDPTRPGNFSSRVRAGK